MKKLIVLIVLILAAQIFTFAQSPLAELDKVREIKLLESTREDVQKVLAEYRLVGDSSSYSQTYSSDKTLITIHYSGGKCSADEEDWNAPEWTATKINVWLKYSSDRIEMKSFGINFADYKKERMYGNNKNTHILYNRKSGLAFETYNKFVVGIQIIPSQKKYDRLCSNESIRKFYFGKSWFRGKSKDRIYETPNFVADVVSVSLSNDEFILNCPANAKNCVTKRNEFNVTVAAQDAENDVLTYDYEISGGKIIGQGNQVIWDLSGEKPGTYTILVGVDDGCGVCGKTITKTVTVKECPNCSVK